MVSGKWLVNGWRLPASNPWSFARGRHQALALGTNRQPLATVIEVSTPLQAQAETDSAAESGVSVGPLDRIDWALAAVLALGALAMFWKVIFTPSMLFFRDVCNYTYPSARFIQEMCRHGVVPYWNPFLNYGQPLLENPNVLFFYPYTLFIILLPIDFAYPFFYVVHVALAGIGTYLLARRWGQSRQASFFAGAAFAFSGPLLSLGNLYNHAACAAWMPWALLATDRAVHGLTSRRPAGRDGLPAWHSLTRAAPAGENAGAVRPLPQRGEGPIPNAEQRSRLKSKDSTVSSSLRRGLRGGAAVRPWILLTLVFSLQFLAAEPFTLIATFCLCFAYALYLRGTLRPLATAAYLRILTGFVLAGCLMITLCAAQFLPSAELLSQSRRGAQGLRYGETSNWSFHPLLLMETLVPDFYGPALNSPTKWNTLLEDGNSPYFLSVFTGFVPLFFALAGWALARDRRRNFIAGSALVFLVLSFGHFSPVFSLTYLLVPLLTLVRFPVKLLVPVVMLVAILAGWGLDALRLESAQWRARRNRALYPLAILLAISLVIWAASWMAPKLVALPTEWMLIRQGHARPEASEMAQSLTSLFRIYVPGISGFVLFAFLLLLGLGQSKSWARIGLPIFALLGLAQLMQVNYEANPTVPRDFFTYKPPVVSRFQGPAGSYRVASMARLPSGQPSQGELQGYVNFQSVLGSAQLSAVAQGTFQERILLGMGSMLLGIEGSLNLDIERSLPPFLYDVWIYMLRQAPDTLHTDCFLGRTNVKYIIQPTRHDSAATSVAGEVFNGSPRPSYLYEDRYCVPRAYVAGTAIFTTSPIETLRRMASPDFEALENVILAAEPGASPAVHASATGHSREGGNPPAGQVAITKRQPNAVTLTASLARPGYVVLLDRYDSNWHATLDGREVPVLRANQLFRAVYAEPGQHVIAFSYRQRGLWLGMFITGITIVVLVWLYVRNPGLTT